MEWLARFVAGDVMRAFGLAGITGRVPVAAPLLRAFESLIVGSRVPALTPDLATFPGFFKNRFLLILFFFSCRSYLTNL